MDGAVPRPAGEMSSIRLALAALPRPQMAVSMAYGVTPPVLPGLVERGSVLAADVEGQTRAGSPARTRSPLFLFAPAWGALAGSTAAGAHRRAGRIECGAVGRDRVADFVGCTRRGVPSPG